jgi:hypothetical protein
MAEPSGKRRLANGRSGPGTDVIGRAFEELKPLANAKMART